MTGAFAHGRDLTTPSGGGQAVVTGFAGFVGSRLTRRLLENEARVTGLDNLSRGRREAYEALACHPNLVTVVGDVRSREDVDRAFAYGADLVFHLAARHFIPECAADPAGTYEINLVGTQRAWDAAVRAGANRFVFVSTGDVYRPSSAPDREEDPTGPFNAYGLSKLGAEQALAIQAGPGRPTLVIARLFNVYGPGDTNPHLLPEIIRQVRAGARKLELGNLWPVRDYVFVSDVAEALVRLATTPDPPGVVNVGTGGGWTVEEVVALVSRAVGFPIEVVSVPGKRRPVERDVLRPDVSRLAAWTGWRPETDLLVGLQTTLEASG